MSPVESFEDGRELVHPGLYPVTLLAQHRSLRGYRVAQLARHARTSR
jgi:hypothetical protein